MLLQLLLLLLKSGRCLEASVRKRLTLEKATAYTAYYVVDVPRVRLCCTQCTIL